MIPPGFRRSDATLHTTFEVPTPSEHVRLVRPRTAVWIADATASSREIIRDGAQVEVALVDPGALDAWDDLTDRLPHGPRVLSVNRVPGPKEDGGRAASERLRRAHCGVDPELPRRVVRCRHDPASVRIASDDQRLLTKFGILELLDGREEGVQVEVGENLHRGKATVGW